MTANSYPGNPSLASEVKERVLSTFSHTLALFDDGQLDEVVAGCDLILEMDDRFEPARKLRQKAKDPAAPVDLQELYALRDGALSDSSPAAGADEGRTLQALEALNAGKYEEAVALCNTILSADPGNEEAQRIGQQANERLEADPFVRQFLQEAEQAAERGDNAAARTMIQKAESLDPQHPGIGAVSAKISNAEETGTADSGGSGFDFGGDSSPFTGAFGASDEPEEPSGGFGGFVAPSGEPETPSSATDEPAVADAAPGFDFSAPESDDTAASESEPPVAAAPDSGADEAANFGFTLEEEPDQSEPPIAQPAVSEPVVGEAQTFDFSTGDVEVSDSDQQKIENYLRDGDDLFESGDYQGAIDSWSKIFLIDVTNEQASERIEQAKERKRSADQRLDDLVTSGVAAYDRGDYQTARQTFEEVLAQDDSNFRAGEYLEKLDDHSAATAGGASESSSLPPPPPPAAIDHDDSIYQGDMYEEEASVPPPPPRTSDKPSNAATTPRAAGKKSPRGLILAVLAVAVLAVGAWFGWSMLGGDEPAQVDTAATQGKINRARLLAEGGDYPQAISVLSSVEPGDPMREQALQLIAQYRQQQAEKGGMVGGRPMNEVRDEFLAQGRSSFQEEDYITAKTAFEEAAKLKPLEGTDRDMYENATRQVSKLQAATTLFAQGSYAEAIDELSAVLEAEPTSVNAREMLVNAHFNLGVTALKNDDHQRAIEEFSLVLEDDPNDAMARRSLEIAQLYNDRPKDLMYEIFIKYLPLR